MIEVHGQDGTVLASYDLRNKRSFCFSKKAIFHDGDTFHSSDGGTFFGRFVGSLPLAHPLHWIGYGDLTSSLKRGLVRGDKVFREGKGLCVCLFVPPCLQAIVYPLCFCELILCQTTNHTLAVLDTRAGKKRSVPFLLSFVTHVFLFLGFLSYFFLSVSKIC